jgi:hypothetical protein
MCGPERAGALPPRTPAGAEKENGMHIDAGSPPIAARPEEGGRA